MSAFFVQRRRLILRLVGVLALLALAGCAHPVSVRPNLTYPKDQTVNTSVGYFISDANRQLEVTTAGGGGDKIRYFPYRDLEPAIIETLGSVYNKVYSVPESGRAAFVADHQLSLVFEPALTTNSSSNSALFWPATDFDLTINVTALDAAGHALWSRAFTGHGHVDKNRSLVDVPPANDAAQQAFGKLRQALLDDPQFRAASSPVKTP